MPYKIDASLGVLNPNQSTSQLVRTSTGNLYAIIISSGDVRVYSSTSNGVFWTQQDYRNSPPTGSTIVSSAIDSSDNIHIVFSAPGPTNVSYVLFNTTTNTFGRVEKPLTVTASGQDALAIAVDSNNNPHIVSSDASAADTLRYTNKLAGVATPFWKTPVSIYTSGGAGTVYHVDLQIDQNNVPQISSMDSALNIAVSIGNNNNSSSFTTTNVVVSSGFIDAGGTSLAIDVLGNTWLGYQGAKDGRVLLSKHNQKDSWAIWQSAVTDGLNGKSISLAADANDIYVFYERNLGGLAYDRYDTINGKWLGETIIQAQIISNNNVLPSFKPHNPFVKWSQYFNNGDTGANNSGQQTIEYLFDAGATVYYDKLVTAQISTGYVNFKFTSGTGGTTTSTSSTSSSTSVSTSTSSTSSSISTSTSSTSSSTSRSTSTSSTSTSQSTSTSLSTSSTSSSTSISTSSTSSSVSTSISSTSQSTSTSVSTSSTSSSTSISTSSTSQSTSTSISTSSTSSSTSSSISTSSTSQSTSVSTSSTSNSTSFSTSSTSVSTSISTSTSSTSQSTSTSLSTSSTSQSTSVSTSSTSASTSLSTSTSSTSQSTSHSTSISTSSTSSSLSTSSTSQSTSLSTSTSSTSQSTSTTVSLTTSTSSTSASTSISTSSTSQSTSISTSSTSISRSTSTSSTSQSTSLSTSTSSTSQSTSVSTSISSTSNSTSVSTSTSSTSSSTSISQSFTTSTSSTSISTSSTSSSTSATTTLLDVNMFPRAIIRPYRIWSNVRQQRPILR